MNSKEITIEVHPRGGWTLAVPVPGSTIRLYEGQYGARWMAEVALSGKVALEKRERVA
jgi:hypothetical protein